MKKTAVYKWVKRFYEERGSVTEEERSGRPATGRTEENIAEVRRLTVRSIAERLTVRSIAERLTVRSIAEQVNIDREAVRKI